MKHLLPICILSLSLLACSENGAGRGAGAPMPETLASEFDETAMDEAIETARNRIDEFLRVLAKNDADSFSVKAPIQDGEYTEHFWVVDVSYRDGSFHGEIGNDPGIVTTVRAGQQWTIKKDEISDWMFTRDGMIHGGFTIDPLLGSFPQDKADEMRAKLVR